MLGANVPTIVEYKVRQRCIHSIDHLSKRTSPKYFVHLATQVPWGKMPIAVQDF